MRRLPVLAWLLFAALRPEIARAAPPAAPPPDVVHVLTMSAGDPLFFKFGHTALWIHEGATGIDRVYNWGTFSFEEPGLVRSFLAGRLIYWLSVTSLANTVSRYQEENRWIVAQELELTPEQTRRLVEKVRENARPENVRYVYDYFRDNCSTRVRDLVDLASGGALRMGTAGPARFTYRQQAGRLTQDSLWGYLTLNLLMGGIVDRPVTRWDEMFIPGELRAGLAGATVLGADGRQVPLVRAEKLLLAADRAPEPVAPPRLVPRLLGAGLVIGVLLGWLARRYVAAARRSRSGLGGRLALAMPLSILSLVTGILGAIFLFVWLLTDHEVGWRNENLLHTSPLALGLFAVSVGVAAGARWAGRALPLLACVLAVESALGLLFKLLPWSTQENGEIIALFLPIWAGLAVGALLGRRAVPRLDQTESVLPLEREEP